MKADIFSDPQDKERISEQFNTIENLRDFIEWLFEESRGIDHLSQTEAWDKFDNWQAACDEKIEGETKH